MHRAPCVPGSAGRAPLGYKAGRQVCLLYTDHTAVGRSEGQHSWQVP